MLDEKDLQAIAQLLSQQKQEIKTELRQELMHDVKILIDADITPKFNLLAENQELLLERVPSRDDLELLESRLDTLELVVKKHSREIAELKKAQ